MITFPKYKLKQLRKDLYGHVKLIAEKNGHPYSSLTAVLNGHYYNQQMIDDCINYRENLLEQVNKQAERI